MKMRCLLWKIQDFKHRIATQAFWPQKGGENLSNSQHKENRKTNLSNTTTMTWPRFVKFALLVALYSLSTLVAMVSAADDEEPSQCELDTEDLRGSPEYESGYMAIVTSLEDIESNSTGGCEENRDGYYWCTGSLEEAALAEHESACLAANGTVHEIENVRINCKGDENTFTNIEMIPECLPASCTDEDEIDDGLEDYVDGLDERAETDAGEQRCAVNKGGDFPHASGAATLAFVARNSLLATVVVTLVSSVLFGV